MEEPVDLELPRERDALRAALGRVGVWSFALETQTAAEERDADLIVVGANPKSWRQRWFHRSVSEELVRRGPCPVLVVR